MYDYTAGPKPIDVAADPILFPSIYTPLSFTFDLATQQDGTIDIGNMNVGSYVERDVEEFDQQAGAPHRD